MDNIKITERAQESATNLGINKDKGNLAQHLHFFFSNQRPKISILFLEIIYPD